ncbi:MAG: hypothetical protein EP330_09685 [Deltaproteobacteria bacterium]|nr:MAG: hypothetical protein EP330_09685 [Deltaproteobacteria bacterium]
MRLAPLALALALALTACDDFSAVQKADTIEAYEQYIQDNPESRMLLQAQERLQTLYLEKAKAEKTLEAYDAYLARFPEGMYVEKAMKEREEFLYAWASEEDSAEGWTKYLDEYPKADRKKKKQARDRIAVAGYEENLVQAEPVFERVNLAEDPNGEKNGWGISVDVTNKGDKTIEDLRYRVRFFDADGKKIGDKTWPLVAQNWGVPMEEEKKVPVKPGETRTWYWMDAFPEADWKGTIKLIPVKIRFEGEAEDE